MRSPREQADLHQDPRDLPPPPPPKVANSLDHNADKHPPGAHARRATYSRDMDKRRSASSSLVRTSDLRSGLEQQHGIEVKAEAVGLLNPLFL
eukprot:6111823-Amphidinium_carterae.5